MPSDFVHLHLHTHYSMLDGACTASGLVKLAQEMDMDSIAITDHGYVGGAEEFHRVLSKAGMKPIVGCEAYVSPTNRFDHTASVPHIKGHHLVLLCENETGYKNLCKLISEAWRNGMYYKPRMDKEILKEYHEGLIALSACIGGEIPSLFLDGNDKAAEKSLDEHLEIFGPDNFFLEIMDHGMEEERLVNKKIIELARRRNIPLVATNDVHYQRREDAEAHEVMLCIQTGAKLSEPHMKFSAPEFYFKSPDEMKKLFAEVPEAITNTRVIADRCAVDPVKFRYGENHYPVFYLPDGSVPNGQTLREICLDNMMMRYDFDGRKENLNDYEKSIIDRMDYELGIIERTGFCSYFMVVSDFIRYGKNIGVPVGPGRGSGAGSLVAYLTLITDIDPMRYGLLFERFLNPERVSPPDFDIDFCEKRRVEVIEYVRQKYGYDNVAQICTYGQLKAKAVVKDVSRVMGLDFDAGNKLTKMIPDELKMTVSKAIEQSEELAALIESDPKVKEVFDFARVLEGLNRQTGVHAAGVIIGDQRLDNLVPLSRSATGDMVVQYPKEPCENLGLLKMDFLGLRTLTIIRNALDMIKEQHGVDINLSKLPLDDKKTYEMLQRGDTIAVFQLESGGMQNLCRSFGVETIEHIIALVALYRPGPMQFIPQFIARKKGTEEIIYDHPKMEEYLKETYGIMVYQEQIMQVVQALAGFSLGGADILRRAIGKKKEDVMKEQHLKFVEGCAKTNNIPAELAEVIWEKIKLFAGYGFNKSHSAAYGVVSYQTAYLKANYPVEFMAAVLTSEIENAEKLAFLITACREMGIKVLPPDINSSGISFSVDSGKIRFGLGAIKGVGEVAASKIIESRKKEGVFTSFQDFCERCGTDVNSRMLEHLTRAGALDGLGLRRSQILAIAEPMMSFAAQKAKDKAAGQGSLFDMFAGDDAASQACSIPIPDIPEFDWEDILKNEKELLGFYVSGHPLEPNSELVNAYGTPIRMLGDMADGTPLRLAGMLSGFTKKFSKTSNKPFGVITLEDFDSSCECMVYERALDAMTKTEIPTDPGTPLLLEINVSKRDENERPRVVVDKVHLLTDAPENFTEELYLHVFEKKTTPEQQNALARLVKQYPGEVKLFVCFVREDDSVIFIESGTSVNPTAKFLKGVTRILGKNSFRIKAKPVRRPAPKRWKKPENEAETSQN